MVGGPGPGDRAGGQTVKLCTGGSYEGKGSGKLKKMVDGDAVALLGWSWTLWAAARARTKEGDRNGPNFPNSGPSSKKSRDIGPEGGQHGPKGPAFGNAPGFPHD